jgi:serine/threonine-protein kinase
LAGLHAAHEIKDDNDDLLQLVHRDVSPQNILVGINGTALITDFGVARAATRLSSTRSGQLKGKLAYMAPEQARGGNLDRRADLFAVGTVLWEVLADKRLFKGEGEADTLNRVLFEPIPSLREVAPHVSPQLEAVTMKALDRDPLKRHQSAAVFGDDLERAVRITHPIASVREVAEYVQKVLGQDIAQQREAVRAWLAQSEPSRTDLDDHDIVSAAAPYGISSSVSSAAISIPPRGVLSPNVDLLTEITRARRKRRKTLWASAATVAVVAGGVVLWSSKHDSAVTVSSASSAVATASASVVAAPPSTVPTSPVMASVPEPPRTAPKGLSVQQLPTVPVRPPAPPPPAPRRPRPAPPPRGDTAPPVEDIPRNPYR